MSAHSSRVHRRFAPLFFAAVATVACSEDVTDTAPNAPSPPVAAAVSSTTSPLIGDFDGEGHSDIAIYDASRARALLDATADGRLDGITRPLGLSTDVPFMGDWDGDGVETLALYRKSANQVIYTNSNKDTTYVVRSVNAVGAGGGIPIRGDWNGNGKDGFAIYDVSVSTFTFYQSMTIAGSFASEAYGILNDLPVSGDWDNDGKDGFGIYRPTAHLFALKDVIGGATTTIPVTSTTGDLPLAGKWHGRSNWSLGLYRPSTKQFLLYNTLSLTTLQTVAWTDPTTLVPTNGRQVFDLNGARHTNSTGVFRTVFDSTQSFLPLGIYSVESETAENGSNMFQQLTTSGFNVAMLWPSLSVAQALQSVGTRNVRLVPRDGYYTTSLDGNSKIIAWFLWDEPHNLADLQQAYNLHPQAVRPQFHINLPPSTTGPICFSSNNTDGAWAAMAALGDVSSLDCYPVYRPGGVHGAFTTFESIADAVTTLRKSASTNRPLWFTAQAIANNDPHNDQNWRCRLLSSIARRCTRPSCMGLLD